ncbi:MAG: hypothetical protein HQL87_15150 [Magnetococcales bacterium]|nr:hypothetical protein [Magnetococcales bacterium]
MNKIKRLVIVLLLTVFSMSGQGFADNHDPKADFKPDFMYGNNDGVSPDYKRAATWFHKVSEQVKNFFKELIGPEMFNSIGNSINHFVEAIKRFFDQSWGKRLEWKAS